MRLTETRFANRTEAGSRLATALRHLRGRDIVVLGLPRGGVPVAAEVARELGAPLDVLVVRKLGVPGQPELALGAIGEDGARVLNDGVLRMVRLNPQHLAEIEAAERLELDRRLRVFRGDRPAVRVRGRTAIVVDDGAATGATARVACAVARSHGAIRVVLALPVAAPSAVADLRGEADEVIVVATPEAFFAIGEFYDDFDQTTDDEVVSVLRDTATDADPRPRADTDVVVSAGGADLLGRLTVPDNAVAVVVFAHGRGSNRNSPRNRYVAHVLNQAGIATLLVDLLTAQELDRRHVFDIALLTQRLTDTVDWLRERPEAAGLPIGLFGASTGAAAALATAAADRISRGEPTADDVRPAAVGAVVSRGGRPDLAGDQIAQVRCPALFIVGGFDHEVLDLNESAREKMTCPTQIIVVPGATHLFEEPGALESVAAYTRDWFTRHLTVTSDARRIDATPAGEFDPPGAESAG